jgi:hypothetical protein
MSAPPKVDLPPVDPQPNGGTRAWTAARVAGTAVGVMVCLAIITLYVVAPWDSDKPVAAGSEDQPVQVAWGRQAVDAQGLEKWTGVTITQVAVTGAGGLVDMRFEVLDPALATQIHDPATPPAVIDERSGLVVHDLFMNHAHSGSFHAGETYYFIFNNPRNWVHRGSKVTVLLGNTAVEHIVVR